ncbi:BnaC04g20010D [Brassica napus]|uniref:BnaC04g20010D protein n=1 Tax=Brassica napus TaxID=3708 RepID=A0A078HAE9_BRANA|nr:BnaC04g20010D [Brassica napus]
MGADSILLTVTALNLTRRLETQ